MSIGTDKGTWFADPGFGSDLWLLKKEGKADGQTAGKLERVERESPRRNLFRIWNRARDWRGLATPRAGPER
jgi:hypothetical protein